LLTNSWSSLFGVVITIIFNLSKNWHYVHYSTILMVGIGLMFVLLHLNESIKYSYLKKDFHQLYGTLETIAVKNNRREEYFNWKRRFKFYETDEKMLEALVTQGVATKKHDYTLKYRLTCIFCNKENAYNFLLFCIIKMVVGAAYAYNGLDMKNTSNMMVNPIIFFLSDFIVIVATGHFIEIPWIGRKRPTIICSFIATLFFYLKYFTILGHGESYSVLWIDIVLRFCINIIFQVLTLWSIEIYPFDIAMLASNLNRLASRIGRIYSPILLLNHRKMITGQIAILMSISSFLILFIKDTTGMLIKDSTQTVEEERKATEKRLSIAKPLENVAAHEEGEEFHKLNEETINKKKD